MIQLKVYDDSRQLNQYWLDLYETEPIKLTLSVEDITNAEAKSVFSRTFRVPATSANNIFFKHAFLIDGVDYDVTVKKPAEIIVDGAEFRQGHIRLQRIFTNGAQDKIDYEIIFLGETRDFSSAIGDASMCSLNMPELSHTINGANVELSWDAYPESASLTAGLKNGDVLYPLVDFGNTYDENGNAEQTRVAVAGSGNNFTSSGHPLELARLKPMIRARKIFGKIFENTGYTFTSTFLDSAFFKQVYVSAWGNESAIDLSGDANSTNTMSATDSNDEGGDSELYIGESVSDPSSGNTATTDGKNYQYIPESAGSYYVAQVAGSYIIRAQAFYAGEGGQQPPFSPIDGRLIIQKSTGGSYTDASVGAYGSGNGSTLTVQGIISLNAGDKVRIYGDIEFPQYIEQSVFRNKEFEVVSAPGNALPNASLDCDYKQIDFIKDILTTYRLVMAPDASDSKNFIIEPFINYIASGDLYDWSDKLIRDKDLVIEPLFNTQSDQIDFTHKDDGDWVNIYHTQAYKNTFGYLQFDSGNELLKGTRKIETNWAPTPLTQITGAPNTSEFIIPQMTTKSAGDAGTQHNPIKPKTRLLFYNGMQPTGFTGNNGWHLEDITGHISNYPLVSYYNEWPMDQDTQVLNWNVDVPYWGTGVTGINGLATAQDLYTTYWSGYIQSLYNSRARRVTGYFTLNNVDLQNFSFDDIVFLDGAYYRPERINDAQIGVTGPVKVQLIKLIDYKPLGQADDALSYTTIIDGPSCFNGSDGSITYVFATPVSFPVSWSSTSGDSGTFNINPGLIQNQTPGTYTITVTDSQGRTDSQQFTVPQSSASALAVTNTITEPSDCYTSDGALTVTASGGTSPYTILFSNGSTSFTQTSLPSANLTYTVTDNVGCTIDGEALVSCQVVIPPGDISYIREYNVGGVCQGETQADDIDVVVIRVNSGNSEPTDGWYCFDGDWASLQSIYGTAQGTLVPMDQDNTCINDGGNDWFYSATSLGDAIREPFDGCFCPNTNGFESFIQTIGTNPYVFVAQI